MSTKDLDQQLWQQWHKTGNPQDASNFVNQMKPLVKNDIYRNSRNAPYALVDAHATNLILEAGKNYKPNHGTTIGTYVKSYMPKLIQRNSEWRTPMRIPETRAYKYSTFNNAQEELKSKLGRDPTIAELSDYLRWSSAEVKRFIRESAQEFTDDRPFASNYNPKPSLEEDKIEYIYHDLGINEKRLFEYTTGYGGRPKLSDTEIMKRMGWNRNQLSYEKKKLVDKIDKDLEL